jgi:hypothetical protein
VWGGLHGIWQIISVSTSKFRSLYPRLLRMNDFSLKVIRVLITFHLVCFGWILFRANSLSDAAYIVRSIPANFLNISGLFVGTSRFEFALALVFIFILLAVELFQRSKPGLPFLDAKPMVLRWSYYYLIVFAIVVFGVTQESQFIYFQF